MVSVSRRKLSSGEVNLSIDLNTGTHKGILAPPAPAFLTLPTPTIRLLAGALPLIPSIHKSHNRSNSTDYGVIIVQDYTKYVRFTTEHEPPSDGFRAVRARLEMPPPVSPSRTYLSRAQTLLKSTLAPLWSRSFAGPATAPAPGTGVV
jgi:hypothetical protein